MHHAQCIARWARKQLRTTAVRALYPPWLAPAHASPVSGNGLEAHCPVPCRSMQLAHEHASALQKMGGCASAYILYALQVALQCFALSAFMRQLILRLGKLVGDLPQPHTARPSAAAAQTAHGGTSLASTLVQRRGSAGHAHATHTLARAQAGRTHVVRHAHAPRKGCVQAKVVVLSILSHF